jgi:uncharacterized cupredoxin-like copper-binding protein
MARLGTFVLILGLAVGETACATTATSASAAASSASTVTATPTAQAATVANPPIVLSEWKVAVATTMKAGKVTFSITNSGTVPHELLVFKSDLDPAAYPKDSAGDIIEDAAGIRLLSDGDNIDPGASQTRTVDLTPGKYLFACNIAGHFMSGMYTVVTVTP